MGPYFAHCLRRNAAEFLIGAGAAYLIYNVYTSIRYHLEASARCPELDDLRRLIENLETASCSISRADLLCEIAIVLKSLSPEHCVCLNLRQIQTIAASLTDNKDLVRIKCYHALQSVLRYGTKSENGIMVVQKNVPLLLSLLAGSESPEELRAALRLLVTLSAHRGAHCALVPGLACYRRVLHSSRSHAHTVMLVIRILYNLSKNKELLEMLLNCKVELAFLRLLQPSTPKDTLLLCLGLLTNLTSRQPLGGARGHQYNESSLHALLYSAHSPLQNALTTLTLHSDERVKDTATYMLSRYPLCDTPNRPKSRMSLSGRKGIWF